MRQIIAVSLAALACSLAQPSAAQDKPPVVVPVEKAPYHMPIFKNDLVMLLNVYLPPGGAYGYFSGMRSAAEALSAALTGCAKHVPDCAPYAIDDQLSGKADGGPL